MTNRPFISSFRPKAAASIGMEFGGRHASVLGIALALARSQGNDFAVGAKPTSLFPNLSGNLRPGFTRLNWLQSENKCNQFVGEVLYRAGLGMPVWQMPDGGVHFKEAEALPRAHDYFAPVESLFALAPGDLIVRDALAKSGEDGAHVEIVASSMPGRMIRTIGARKDGAALRDSTEWLRELMVPVAPGVWIGKSYKTYLLRPRLALGDL